MAIFSLEIADVDVDRVLDAVASNYGWRALVANPAYIVTSAEEPNPNYDPNDPETGGPTITVAVYPVDENGDPVPAHIDNPVTKGDFTHKMVRRFLSQHVTQHETALARAQALTGLDTTVDLGDPG